MNQPGHTRFAHWLHECIVESKLVVYPLHVQIYLQTRQVSRNCLERPRLRTCPRSLLCSAITVDQLLVVEKFYNSVRNDIGSKRDPLLSEDFLVARCAAVRDAFSEGGNLSARLGQALRTYYSDGSNAQSDDSDAALVG